MGVVLMIGGTAHIRKVVSELTEVWKDIKGYEGIYQVSNMGNVKRLDCSVFVKGKGYRHLKARNTKQHLDHHGYKKVHLWKNNKDKPFFVHRLVAMAFLDNPNNYPQINHKDENKENNEITNLEWCTVAYNNNYGTKIERVRESLKKFYANR